MRAGSAWRVLLVGVIFLAGCAHKRPRAVMPTIVSLPVDLLDVPEPPLPRIASVPMPGMRVPLASHVAREVRRLGKRPPVRIAPAIAGTPAAPAAAPAAPVAAPAPPADAGVIGSLTAGSDNGAEKQAAGDAIVDIEKRLAGLSPEALKAKQAQMVQVRDFVKKAREALDSGDASGAMTLATKARLLLDDSLK